MCTSSQRTKALTVIGGFLGATSTNHVRSLNFRGTNSLSFLRKAYTFPEDDTITRATSSRVMNKYLTCDWRDFGCHLLACHVTRTDSRDTCRKWCNSGTSSKKI
ncbi:hypothetical protein V1478_001969 [Vespula squamosa]|uniref:Secreted protein n=1 Tax=Vespula squamosa TaxID=30214 RepID=A0ABD2C094_VESSQ